MIGSTGSSPPARGTLSAADVAVPDARFIPACAGNTSLIRVSWVRISVHPRLRGEHGIESCLSVICLGSSPPARGTRGGSGLKGRIYRFIPACAGNTAPGTTISPSPSVHPRLRGEHSSVGSIMPFEYGSSPPARGTRRKHVWRDGKWRFIPACAGNTVLIARHSVRSTVHPRLRGEHQIALGMACRSAGSSPPARGTRIVQVGQRFPPRFIPACAGNTWAPCFVSGNRAVHPRLRGEHPEQIWLDNGRAGSSPPARGTPMKGFCAGYLPRFIPACAGNTSTSWSVSSPSPVHPRLRGEHTKESIETAEAVGSSPPARGTPSAHPD